MQPEPGLTRRAFLGRTAGHAVAGAATVAAGLGLPGMAGCRRTGVPLPSRIDTHTHFYDPTRPGGVPWPGPEDPFLHRPVLPSEFLRLARPHGVTSTVVVEASPWIEDNAWVLALADRHPELLGLVGRLEPGRPGFATSLARFAADRRFRGIRLGSDGVLRALADKSHREDLDRAAERGLAVDVLVGPEQLGDVAALARAVPRLRLVIDHCANVRIDGGRPPEAWLAGMRACAAHPGIAVKLSGLVEGTGRSDGTAPADPGYYAPVLEAVRAAFGEERLCFGSNWPVSARFASYGTVVGIVAAYASSLGDRAEAALFSGNAARWYGLAAG